MSLRLTIIAVTPCLRQELMSCSKGDRKRPFLKRARTYKFIHISQVANFIHELDEAVFKHFKELYEIKNDHQLHYLQTKDFCDLDPRYKIADVLKPDATLYLVVDQPLVDEKRPRSFELNNAEDEVIHSTVGDYSFNLNRFFNGSNSRLLDHQNQQLTSLVRGTQSENTENGEQHPPKRFKPRFYYPFPVNQPLVVEPSNIAPMPSQALQSQSDEVAHTEGPQLASTEGPQVTGMAMIDLTMNMPAEDNHQQTASSEQTAPIEQMAPIEQTAPNVQRATSVNSSIESWPEVEPPIVERSFQNKIQTSSPAGISEKQLVLARSFVPIYPKPVPIYPRPGATRPTISISLPNRAKRVTTVRFRDEIGKSPTPSGGRAPSSESELSESYVDRRSTERRSGPFRGADRKISNSNGAVLLPSVSLKPLHSGKFRIQKVSPSKEHNVGQPAATTASGSLGDNVGDNASSHSLESAEANEDTAPQSLVTPPAVEPLSHKDMTDNLQLSTSVQLNMRLLDGEPIKEKAVSSSLEHNDHPKLLIRLRPNPSQGSLPSETSGDIGSQGSPNTPSLEELEPNLSREPPKATLQNEAGSPKSLILHRKRRVLGFPRTLTTENKVLLGSTRYHGSADKHAEALIRRLRPEFAPEAFPSAASPPKDVKHAKNTIGKMCERLDKRDSQLVNGLESLIENHGSLSSPGKMPAVPASVKTRRIVSNARSSKRVAAIDSEDEDSSALTIAKSDTEPAENIRSRAEIEAASQLEKEMDTVSSPSSLPSEDVSDPKGVDPPALHDAQPARLPHSAEKDIGPNAAASGSAVPEKLVEVTEKPLHLRPPLPPLQRQVHSKPESRFSVNPLRKSPIASRVLSASKRARHSERNPPSSATPNSNSTRVSAGLVSPSTPEPQPKSAHPKPQPAEPRSQLVQHTPELDDSQDHQNLDILQRMTAQGDPRSQFYSAAAAQNLRRRSLSHSYDEDDKLQRKASLENEAIPARINPAPEQESSQSPKKPKIAHSPSAADDAGSAPKQRSRVEDEQNDESESEDEVRSVRRKSKLMPSKNHQSSGHAIIANSSPPQNGADSPRTLAEKGVRHVVDDEPAEQPQSQQAPRARSWDFVAKFIGRKRLNPQPDSVPVKPAVESTPQRKHKAGLQNEFGDVDEFSPDESDSEDSDDSDDSYSDSSDDDFRGVRKNVAGVLKTLARKN